MRMHIIVGLLIIGVSINGIDSDSTDLNDGWKTVFSINDWAPIIPLHRYGNKVYYLGTQFLATWQQAADFCERIHMTLLTIHSEDENDIIFKYTREANQGTEYWTGGSRLIDGYHWLWMSYGKTINYTHWYPGQPGIIYNKCLSLWVTGKALEWYSRHCDTRLYFICEKIQKSSNSHSQSLSL